MKRNFEYWSRRAWRYWYTRHTALDTETLKVLLKRNLALYRPATILEVGCGPGIFTEELGEAAEVISVDLSNVMLRFAKGRGMGDALVQADMNMLPFKHESFDAIVAYRVLEYSSDAVKTLKEFSRLAPMVLLQLPRYDSINGLRLLFKRLIFTIFGPAPRFRAYSIKDAIRLARTVGLRIRSIITYNKGLDMHLTLTTNKDEN
jgi:SAM-dependent methyltransferase